MYQMPGMGESTSSLDSLKEAVHDLKSQLDSITSERNMLEKALRKVQKGQDDEVESVLTRQAGVYESRLTELHSVIAELKKQLDIRRDKIIPEESNTDFEDHFEEIEDETDLHVVEEDEYFEDNHFVDHHPIITQIQHPNTTPKRRDVSSKNDGILLSSSTDSNTNENNRDPKEDSLSSSYENHPHINGEIVIKVNSSAGESSANNNLQNPYNQQQQNDLISSEGDSPGGDGRKNQPKRSRRNKQKRNRNFCQGYSTNQIHDLSNSVGIDVSKNKRGGSSQPDKIESEPKHPLQFASLCQEVAQIREEHVAIRDSLCKKESELDKAREALENISTERDFLRNKVLELESMLKEGLSMKNVGVIGTGQETKNLSKIPQDSSPICKLAERVQLRSLKNSQERGRNGNINPILKNGRTNESSRHQQKHSITGVELMTIGRMTCSTKVVEQLVHPIQSESKLREMQQEDINSGSGSINEERLREFEIEMERLSSKVEHLKCQNDVLTMNLEDSKGHADNLTVLLGKYESNNVAMQISLNYSDETITAYDILVALLESELGQLLANCRAAGIGSGCPSSSSSSNNLRDEQELGNINLLLARANENRMTAENAARNLLCRVSLVDSPNGSENNNTLGLPSPGQHQSQMRGHQQQNQPWDESSCSQTLSSGSSSVETNGSPTTSTKQYDSSRVMLKSEEGRIRDFIIMLKTDRENVRSTIMELESCWDMEPLLLRKTCCDTLEARRMDLETAVLMQELMAMREERAELRAQLFLFEREKRSLELRLQGYESQEEVYKARINHLKSEILDYQSNVKDTMSPTTPQLLGVTPQQDSGTNLDGNANNNSPSTTDFCERERVLKRRIQELATTLDRVISNSNIREKQNQEMSNELKHANEMLIDTLESCKRKYQLRLKKMEEQFIHIMEKHSLQIKFYKDQLFSIEQGN